MRRNPIFAENEIILDPGTGALTFQPEVDLFTDQKTLSLTHRSPFTQATCIYYLSSKRSGTEVRIELVMDGLGPFLGRFLGRRITAQVTVESALRGLKRYSERMA
ncbi:MAG: hypothetical protein AAGE94_25925 [Acidobacteriota bacterium]